MLTRRFEEQGVGGGAFVTSRWQRTFATAQKSKTSCFTAGKVLPSSQRLLFLHVLVLFPEYFYMLFFFGVQSLRLTLSHWLRDPAGGLDLRVPNPQRGVCFKELVI